MKPSLKKPRDFTVAEGHGHPLVFLIASDTYNQNGCSYKQVTNNKQSQVVNDILRSQIHIHPSYVYIYQSLL
jgi:hypothetical protein